MNIFKAFQPRKKELGLPAGVQWQYVNGIFVPFDNLDSVYIEKAFKAIPVVQSIVSKIAERAADATPQVMRIKSKREAEKFFAIQKSLNGKDRAQRLAEQRVKAFEQVDNHPFLEVMDNPNPTMTGRELRVSSFAYALITGNGIEYNSMPGAGARATQPIEIWSIPSPCVKPVMSGDAKDPLKEYAITYSYNKNIPKNQITHFKYFNPVSVNIGDLPFQVLVKVQYLHINRT